jgi:esterase/lipase
LNILIDLENKTSILSNLFESIDSIICETTFNYIENFKVSFEKDFTTEENRIKTIFQEIRKSIDNLEIIQLEALKKSKDEFLNNKFDNIFKEAEITKKFYSFYKESKSQCILISKTNKTIVNF